MTSEKDTDFRDLLSKLEILGDDVVDEAVQTQQEDESRGLSLPLAAVLVRRGFLAYPLAERLLAHQAGLPLLCDHCDTRNSAADLDPRVPFQCRTCGQEVEPEEAPEEFSLAETVPGMLTKEKDNIIGRVLGGCKVERKIGAGGMGAVYVANQEYLRRKVAIKILPRDHVRQPGFVKRFLRESRSAAQVIHPNVVQVMDAGQDGDLYYIVMEFVEGKSLYEVLREKGRVRPYEAVKYGREIALGLAAAHKHGIIHRDIKPDNIRLNEEGVAKVADFGLAKGLNNTTDITRPGAVVGTPLYMSPEQARGEMVDFRSDIYSLGATLYHLIAGRPPFRASSTSAILQKQKDEEPPALDDPTLGCPEMVAALIRKMMAKELDDRFESYDQLIQAMDGVISRSPSTRETLRIRAPSRKGRMVYVIIAVAAVLIGGGLGAWILFGEKPPPEEPPEKPPVVIPDLPASVLVDTPKIAKAKVYLDGKLKGETPFLMEGIKPGSYRVQVRARGHQEVEREVELASGSNPPLTFDLEALLVSFTVITTPPGARIRVDGEEAGTAPVTGDGLVAGKHAFLAEMEGYEPARWDVELTGEEGSVERRVDLARVAPVREFLRAVEDVASLLERGFPLQADRRLRKLRTEKAEVEQTLFQDEEARVKDLKAQLQRDLPEIDLALKFGAGGESTLEGSPLPVPSKPKGAGALGMVNRQYTVEARVIPRLYPLTSCVLRFSLVRRKADRILDGTGSRDVSVTGPRDVQMVVLLTVSGELTGETVDDLAGRALRTAPSRPREAGPAILRSLDRALEAQGQDFAIRAAWFDERGS